MAECSAVDPEMSEEENFLAHTKFKDLEHETLSDSDWHRIAIELFNDGFFFESHEAWEEIWQTNNTADRNFYQGLIQLAAVLVHSTNKNLKGMQRLKTMAFEKLEKYPRIHVDLDLGKLMDDFTQYLRLAETDLDVLSDHARPQIKLIITKD